MQAEHIMPKRKSPAEWVTDFRNCHGPLYDYTSALFGVKSTPITIYCPIHEKSFEQRPDVHRRGGKCPECSRLQHWRKDSTDSFITKATNVHGDRYLYDLVKYTGSQKLVTIICRLHGRFQQQPGNHINQRSGCPTCGDVEGGLKGRLTKAQFLHAAKTRHGPRYDYSLAEYVQKGVPVNIICKDHGPFAQDPGSHCQGRGCPLCSYEERAAARRFTTDQYVAACRSVHGDCFKYHDTVYQGLTQPVIVECATHGSFSCKASAHLYDRGGCRKCRPVQYSKVSIDWLTQRAREDGVFIQHAENLGEFSVQVGNYKRKVDGYAEATKTIYEFHGTYYHGDPRVYAADFVNRTTGHTMGFLYERTIQKMKLFRAAGYQVVEMWELDFRDHSRNTTLTIPAMACNSPKALC